MAISKVGNLAKCKLHVVWSGATLLQSSEDRPSQPILDCYDPKERRDFLPSWYKKFPFIEFCPIEKKVSSYAQIVESNQLPSS